jgi:hypothetical protein
MATVITSPADVVNLALSKIGIKDRIGNIYEGSAAAKAALDIYSQTRDEMLRSSDWGFAEKIAAGVLTGNAAPFPWTFEYAYPTDCVKVRNLFGATYIADTNDPRPTLWTVGGIAAAKVIWAKIATCTLVYTKQVTDPSLWEPLFVEAFADALGKRIAPVLATADAAKMVGEQEKADAAQAMGTIG